jgi:hypothetical protein
MAELSALIGAENAAAARDVYAAVAAHAHADERLKARLSMHTDRPWVLPLWHTLLGASCTAYASCMVHAVLCCVLHVACCALHAGAMLCDVVLCMLRGVWRNAVCCMQTVCAALNERRALYRAHSSSVAPLRVLIVGAGPAGLR